MARSRAGFRIIVILAVSGAVSSTDVSGDERVNEAPKKIEIIGAVVQHVIGEGFHPLRRTVCVVGWDEATERYRVRGNSGKGQYLQAITQGRFDGSRCRRELAGLREPPRRPGSDVTWVMLGLARGRGCDADYCVGFATDQTAWDYRVRCSQAKCEVVGKIFIAME